VLPLLAAVVALACVAASARRIWLAANATALHPEEALAAVKTRGAGAFRAAAEREPAADWERDLLAALAASDAQARVALVNEQLTELDWRIQRWQRVPRVCASIAASFAFLLATLVLRQGLAGGAELLDSDAVELVVRGLVGDALSVAALGLVGTAFCIAAQSQSKRIAAARLKAADRLVEALEKEEGSRPRPAIVGGTPA
jgi:hypothetical protein